MPARLTPGIDVSNHQRTIRWPDVAQAGYRFALIKASESVDFVDPFFARNWARSKEAGLFRGAYHFARPSRNPVAAHEADFFLNTIADEVGDLEQGDILALDLESGSGPLGRWALDWLTHVTERAGFRPIIYSSPSFLSDHGLTHDPNLAEFGLWLASWRATFPPTPPAWPFIAFWQQGDNGQVPGVQGPCDFDFFNGAPERIPLYGKPAPGVRRPARERRGEEVRSGSYVLRVGETAGGLATSWGLTRAQLEAANPDIRDLGALGPGDVLSVPPATYGRPEAVLPAGEARGTFPVRRTTSLAAVASQLDVNMLALQIWNPELASADLIPAGTLLTVPPRGEGATGGD